MDAKLICYCILLLSGSFALLSLGILILRTSNTLNQVTHLLCLVEPTIDKVNLILDDINVKLDMLNAPVDLVSGIFSKNGLKNGVFSTAGFITSLLHKKDKRKKG